MKIHRSIFTLWLLILAAAPIANGIAAETNVLHNVAYGADKAQTMDIYIPPDAQNSPVIFMVHGGGWRFGDKDNNRVVKNKVARWLPRGFIFITIDYRMLPQLNGLQQADDVASALAFAQAHAASWGGDPSQFILMGHSAGAHLVALLSAAPDKAYTLGAKPWLGTVALDSAAYNIPDMMTRKHLALYDNAFGSDRNTWEQASPFYVVNRNATPLFAVCSTQRRDRPCDQVHAFANKAKTLGLDVKILEEDLSHGDVNAQLGLPGAYTDAVETFMAALSPQTRKLFMQ